MWVSGNFAQLGDLQQSVLATRTGVEGEQETWRTQTNQLIDAWPDDAGLDLQSFSAAADTFGRVNGEFLQMLGAATGKANEALQAALNTASRAVNG
ncbi:hypothetical protein ACFHW0_25920 [Micromonospora sp. LOL_025]|uniref:hypothetical protein n=1 Tax=Micromonospora sp. LOL_025 TaxID=3345413 RepID=UPI003A8B9A81